MQTTNQLNIDDLLKPEDGFTKREDGMYWKLTREDPFGKNLYTAEQALKMTMDDLRWARGISMVATKYAREASPELLNLLKKHKEYPYEWVRNEDGSMTRKPK